VKWLGADAQAMVATFHCCRFFTAPALEALPLAKDITTSEFLELVTALSGDLL
jgi:hypothetical protein